MLLRIVQGLADDGTVALARIWMIAAGDQCSSCRLRSECAERQVCLDLVASAGRPLHSPGDWSRVNGEFRRIPLGSTKIGSVALSGTPVLVSDRSMNWTTRQEFADREGIRAFAAQPLVFRGEILGVLAIFSRIHLPDDHLLWLRTLADQAASVIAHVKAENAQLRGRVEAENTHLREEAPTELASTAMIGRSAVLKRLAEQIALVAPTEASVLIQGESGTGKELAARAIHNGSRRRDRPLVRVNCGSIPRELFESEFFGHSKGAFTGALRDRVGRFQLAHGGTLFLDEVGEIPLELQSKLLRVLQERQYERVGEDRTRHVNVRIIAATNRELDSEVNKGLFREDLFYRLNVFPLFVPPLRSRKEDIEPMARYFIEASCRRLGIAELALSPEELDRLQAYDWPGNVRELQNMIERAVIQCQNGHLRFDALKERSDPLVPGEGHSLVLEPSNCPPAALGPASFLSEEDWIKLERENLTAVLREAGGRVGGPGGAAQLLGIRPTTLRSRLKARGIHQSNLQK